MEEITVRDEDAEYVIAGEPWDGTSPEGEQLFIWRIVSRREEAES